MVRKEKLDEWKLGIYLLRGLAILVLFFMLVLFAHGGHFEWHENGGYKWQAMIFMSLGTLIIFIGPSILAGRLENQEKETGLRYLVVAIGLVSLLWGYLQLFRATGLDTVRSLLLFGDLLTIGFFLYVRMLAKETPAERLRVMMGGVILAVVLGIYAGVQHFGFHNEGMTLALKGQYLVIMLFGFAMHSHDDQGDRSSKK